MQRHGGGIGGLFATPPLLRHLRFDLINLLDRVRALSVLTAVHGLHEGRTTNRSGLSLPGARLGRLRQLRLAQLAQSVELTFAHKVVLALALQHFLERLLAVLALFAVLAQMIQLRPIDRRVAHKTHHLGQQATRFILFFCHGQLL